ncbi:hypothetical protein DMUE_3005 [Dictyocoela muelleri]|nr:hypothetical protein DMUE_3005 [Dictyocoela muelleri]
MLFLISKILSTINTITNPFEMGTIIDYKEIFESKSTKLKILTSDNQKLFLDKGFTSKFKYFSNNKKCCIYDDKINSSHIKKIIKISEKSIYNYICKHELFAILSLIVYLDPKDHVINNIYDNFINSFITINIFQKLPELKSLDCDNLTLNKDNDLVSNKDDDLTLDNYDYSELHTSKNFGTPIFWYKFFKAGMMSKFSLKVSIQDTNLKICDFYEEKNKNIYEYQTRELTKITINNNIVVKIKKQKDIKYFSNVFKFFIDKFINKKLQKIKKLELQGITTIEDLEMINFIFNKNNKNFVEIFIENFDEKIFSDYYRFKSTLCSFLNKFPDLTEFKFYSPRLYFCRSVEIMIYKRIVRKYFNLLTVEYQATMSAMSKPLCRFNFISKENVNNIDKFDTFNPNTAVVTKKELILKYFYRNLYYFAEIINNLGIFDKLSINCCDIKINVLNFIIKNEMLKTTLKELRIHKIINLNIDFANLISNLLSLEVLTIDSCCLEKYSLEIILKSKNLHKTLKTLEIRGIGNYQSRNGFFIENFKVLENLDLSYTHISNYLLICILESKKLQKNIRKFVLRGKIFFSIYYFNQFSNFINLVHLDLSDCDLTTCVLNIILNNNNLQKSLNVLLLEGNRNLNSNHISMFFCFKKLQYLSIRNCNIEIVKKEIFLKLKSNIKNFIY